VTYDTTPLERDCVLLNCSKPAVDPGRGKVHCAAHDPDPPKPSPTIIGQDPDTQEPEPATMVPSIRDHPPTPDVAPDMATMEPYWDGRQWVLKPKREGVRVACPACGVGLEIELRGLLE
jgi:hypothetical protein